MLIDAADDLIPYVICLLPGLVVAWAWVQWRRERAALRPKKRMWLTSTALIIGSASGALLMAFPGVLHYLQAVGSHRADGWYIYSVRAGLLTSAGAAVASPFGARGLRLRQVAAALLLFGIWFLVGALY